MIFCTDECGRTKEPTWNEEFALNIKQPPMHSLQVVMDYVIVFSNFMIVSFMNCLL